jgi:hypothetical protein
MNTAKQAIKQSAETGKVVVLEFTSYVAFESCSDDLYAECTASEGNVYKGGRCGRSWTVQVGRVRGNAPQRWDLAPA